MRRQSEIIAIAKGLGWEIRKTRKGFNIYPPNGSRPVAIHQSKHTDRRARQNMIAQMRRAGADI